MLRRNAACAALTCCTTFALLARTRPGATPALRRGARPMAAASSLDLLGGLRDADGAPVDAAALAGVRVGLYFAAGWCPMCTSFEPSLLQFRAATASGESAASPVALVLVSSDGDAEAARTRAKALGMLQVDYGKAAELKAAFKIWAGKERPEFGDGRRSGVPAIVCLGSAGLEELHFLPAESQGAKVLGEWPAGGEW